MAGRRPKPTIRHRLEGTFHASKHGRDRRTEPRPDADLGDPPLDLTDTQTAIWHETASAAPPGMLKDLDRRAMVVLCEAADRHNTARAMQDLIDRDAQLKLLTKGKNGTLIESPYNRILDKTAKTILAASDRLGLNPTARPRIQLGPPQTPDAPDLGDDPWSRLRLVAGGRRD
jgi:P27 family predicted phage terminase small subunit